MYGIKVMVEDISLPISKTPRKYFALLNCGSNQNQETFGYWIENQTQCHHTPITCHTILHPTVATIQYRFQLCQYRSPFCSFYTCDPLGRTACGNKKRCFIAIC